MEIMGYKDLKENLVIREILENKDLKEMLERKEIKVHMLARMCVRACVCVVLCVLQTTIQFFVIFKPRFPLYRDDDFLLYNCVSFQQVTKEYKVILARKVIWEYKVISTL